MKIEHDDFEDVEIYRAVELAARMFRGLLRKHADPPEYLDDEGKQKYSKSQTQALKQCEGMMKTIEDIDDASSYCTLAVKAAVDLHRTGIPVNKLRMGKRATEVIEKKDEVEDDDDQPALNTQVWIMSRYRVDISTKCSERIERMAEIVEENKLVARHLLKGTALDDFAHSPEGFLGRKGKNFEGNVKKGKNIQDGKQGGRKPDDNPGGGHLQDDATKDSELNDGEEDGMAADNIEATTEDDGVPTRQTRSKKRKHATKAQQIDKTPTARKVVAKQKAKAAVSDDDMGDNIVVASPKASTGKKRKVTNSSQQQNNANVNKASSSKASKATTILKRKTRSRDNGPPAHRTRNFDKKRGVVREG